jgi:hypothetical protein
MMMMTKQATNTIAEYHELGEEQLHDVNGGMRFFGMGCSVNQSARIGAFVDSLGGGILSGIATAIAQIYCA